MELPKYVIEGPGGFFARLVWTNDAGAYYGNTTNVHEAWPFVSAVEAHAVLKVLLNCRPQARLKVKEVVAVTEYILKEVE